QAACFLGQWHIHVQLDFDHQTVLVLVDVLDDTDGLAAIMLPQEWKLTTTLYFVVDCLLECTRENDISNLVDVIELGAVARQLANFGIRVGGELALEVHKSCFLHSSWLHDRVTLT